MTCTESLPLELIDLSIEFLHTDTQSLCACSLVCRRWLPSARFHLFEFIEIYQSLQAAGSRRRCRYPANTLPFIELLENRNNTISPYIRGVMLDVTGVDILNRLINALYNARVDITKLVAITYRQNLTFLSRFSQVFPRVTTLEVKIPQTLYHTTEDYTRMYQGLLFATSFPMLETLYFDASFESDANIPTSVPVNIGALHNLAFYHLRTLTLRVQDSETIVSWLRGSGRRLQLRKISVHVYHNQNESPRQMPHLDALLEDCHDTLEDFTVVVNGSEMPSKSTNQV